MRIGMWRARRGVGARCMAELYAQPQRLGRCCIALRAAPCDIEGWGEKWSAVGGAKMVETIADISARRTTMVDWSAWREKSAQISSSRSKRAAHDFSALPAWLGIRQEEQATARNAGRTVPLQMRFWMLLSRLWKPFPRSGPSRAEDQSRVLRETHNRQVIEAARRGVTPRSLEQRKGPHSPVYRQDRGATVV